MGKQDMAGRVRSQQQGSGKVTRQESFKVSQMVHQRLGTAASSQGFGPHATQVMATDSLDTLEEELDSLQVCSIDIVSTQQMAIATKML